MIEINFVLNFINYLFSKQTIEINVLNFNVIKILFSFILIKIALDFNKISLFFLKLNELTFFKTINIVTCAL